MVLKSFPIEKARALAMQEFGTCEGLQEYRFPREDIDEIWHGDPPTWYEMKLGHLKLMFMRFRFNDSKKTNIVISIGNRDSRVYVNFDYDTLEFLFGASA